MASIEDFKSIISQKGGVARTNKFRVLFTPPKGSLFNIDPEAILGSLLGGSTGNFNAKNLINDPRAVSFLCSSATIPGSQIQTLDFQGQKQTVKVANTFIHEEVTLKFILTNDYYIKKLFDNWLSQVVDLESHTVGYKEEYSCDVIIQQLNSKGKVVYGVKLFKAFPTTVTGIEFDAGAENAYGELSVTFSYDRYQPEGAISSALSGAGAVLDILNN